MGNFNQGGPSRFGGNRGGGSRFGGDRRDSRGGGSRFGGDREMTMHQATCAECHKSCEVPFRPTSDRPVYCKDCFASRGGAASLERSPRGDFNNRPFSKPRFGDNKSQNFGKDRSNDDVARQLESINVKLDKLISILGGTSAKKTNLESPKKEGLKEAVKEAVQEVTPKTSTKKKVSKKK